MRGSIENPSTPINATTLSGYVDNSAGVSASVRNTIGITAVWNANQQISQDIATFPISVYQKNGDTKIEHPDHPIIKTLSEPNAASSGFVFRESLMTSYNLRGNGLAYIHESKGNKELRLVRADGKTKPMLSSRGNKFWDLDFFDGSFMEKVPDRKVIHIPNICMDGYWGIDPITNFKEALGLTLAQEKYNSEFYKNGASLQTIVENPTPLKEGDGDRIRAEWMRLYGAGGTVGKNGLGVIGGGTKIHQIGINPEQSQFLQSRVFQIEEISRMFNIPLHKLKSLNNQPKSNVEQLSKEYYTDTLQPIVTKLEIELTRKLLTEEEKSNGFSIKFNMDEFLRADVETRFKAYQVATTSQFMTPNEIRQKEGMQPIEGGDAMVSFQTPANSIDNGEGTEE